MRLPDRRRRAAAALALLLALLAALGLLQAFGDRSGAVRDALPRVTAG